MHKHTFKTRTRNFPYGIRVTGISRILVTYKWWVTVFNPDYQDVKASELTPTYTVDFSKNKDMFKAFYNTWNGVEDVYGNTWKFDTKNNTASLTFKGGQVSK